MTNIFQNGMRVIVTGVSQHQGRTGEIKGVKQDEQLGTLVEVQLDGLADTTLHRMGSLSREEVSVERTK